MEERPRRTVLDRIFPSRWMRRDWDERARRDARRFIACGHSASDAAFWESGRRDLEETVLHDVILAPEARALEIGCGIGRLLRPLSERVAEVHGVDISTEMVAQARRALADRKNVQVTPTLGGLEFVAEGSLDFVYSFIVFQHVPTKKLVARYISEAGRVLSGGGVFRFQVDGRPRDGDVQTDTWLGVWYEPDELAVELDRAGFEMVNRWGERTHYLWVTARRKQRPGPPARQSARIRRRTWRREAVEELLDRLGAPRVDADRVLSGQVSLRELAEPLLDGTDGAGAEALVRRAYRVLLGREADQGGLGFYAKEIESGIPASNMIDCLIASPELEEQVRRDSPAG